MQKQKDNKKPASMMVLLIVGATIAMVAITMNPSNYIPVQTTENAEIIAVIDARCVVETNRGHSYVVPDCNSVPGSIDSTTFHVPGAEPNGYYDRIEDKMATVEP